MLKACLQADVHLHDTLGLVRSVRGRITDARPIKIEEAQETFQGGFVSRLGEGGQSGHVLLEGADALGQDVVPEEGDLGGKEGQLGRINT